MYEVQTNSSIRKSFEEQESVTLWVSDDKNRIPVRIKADILVGSIKADLENFKNLKHPFQIIVK